jgi:hypothetical protein
VSLIRGSADVAVALADYGGRRVYFLDDGVFVETDGFWVRGGRATSFVVDGTAGPVALDLANGGSPNDVVVRTTAGEERVPLEPFASRRIVVAAPPGGGPVRVRLDSPGGFRPSETGSSRDARYLGVRVTLASP